IGIVDSVDLGGLEENFGADFAGAQSGGGVGGEKRIAGARAEDDDAALIHVAQGAASDVGFGQGAHFDGGHDAGGHALLVEHGLHGKGVDDGGQHADVVAGGLVEADLGAPFAAEDVAPADDEADLHAEGVD